MAGPNDLTKDVDIDVKGLFSHVWNRKFLIILISVLTGVGLYFVFSQIAPRYKSISQILIEQRESIFTRSRQQANIPNNNQFDTAAILSQVQIILSDDVAKSTIRKLNLADIDEFKNAYKSSLLTDIMVVVGLKDSKSVLSLEERVLKAYKERLKAYSIEQSRVIAIEFWANDRTISQKVANTIAEEYLSLQRQAKLETNTNATQFLEPEIVELRKRVRAAESKVAEYRANSDILVGNNNALLATQQLSEVSTELSRLRSRRSAAQATVDSIRATLQSGGSLDSIPEVMASPLVQRLRERQVQLRAQISELSVTLLPSHPRLKALNSQVADFDRQIKREIRSILKSLENNVGLTTKQENSMLQELNRLKAESSRAGEAEVELRALEREAASERELLQAYLTRFREAVGRQSSNYQPIDARIISKAPLPTESFFPKTIPFAIAGSIVAAVMSVIFILAASLLGPDAMKPVPAVQQRKEPEAFDPTTYANDTQPALDEPEEIRNHSPVISHNSVIPEMQNSFDLEPGPAANQTGSAPSVEPDISVSLAVAGLKEFGHGRIAVVSPGGDEGSATTWLLARQLAHNNATVAVIDMTGSGITSSHMLGNINQAGISDCMAGEAEFESIIHRDVHSSAAILPIGVSQPQDIDMAMERLGLIVEALEASYDYLIIDCGLTNINGVMQIANENTIVIISAPGCSETRLFESNLIENGFIEAISVNPSKSELSSIANMAA